LRIGRGRDAFGEIVGDVEPPANAVDPACLVLRITLGRRWPPQPFTEQLLATGEADGIDDRDAGRAHHADAPLARTLQF
jgi:hypothetical protein